MDKLIRLITKEMGLAGIDIGTEEVQAFAIYFLELKRWNSKYNLIGLRDDIQIIRRLFVSSANFLRLLPQSSSFTVADIGSGGGFPGIPLKILRPELKVICIDSNKKKVMFLKHIVRVLSLDVATILGRAEDVSVPKGGEYDCVVAHSVGTIRLLAELSLPLLKEGGILIMRKGIELEEELKEISVASLPYALEDRVEVSPQGEEDYTLVSMKKCST